MLDESIKRKKLNSCPVYHVLCLDTYAIIPKGTWHSVKAFFKLLFEF